MKYFILLITALLIGCATPLEVKRVDSLSSVSSIDDKTHSLNLKRMVSTLKKGQPMEYFLTGFWCEMPLGGPIGSMLGWDFTVYSKGPGAPIYFNEDEIKKVNENKEGFQAPDYRVITRDTIIKTLKDHNISINDSSDLELSLRVTDHKSNVCIQYPGIGPNHKGEVYIKAEWEIYSKHQKKVMHKSEVESFSEKTSFSTTSAKENVIHVYEDLTKKLINDPDFRKLIDSKNLYIKDEII
jgi:hypothetical protein